MKKAWTTLFAVLVLHAAAPVAAIAGHEPVLQKQPLIDTKDDPEPKVDGLVEVSFKIDSEGKIQILNINSTSPQLAEYVIKKLSKVKLEQGSSQTGKVIKYSFVFKKQA
jgi:hypothetical protein